jgi:hypothetical protein
MSPSDRSSGRAGPLIDSKFAKRFVMVCGAVPALLLAWDAYRHQLGVNGVNFAIRTTGMVGLVFLMLSLVVTPLRRLTGLQPGDPGLSVHRHPLLHLLCV